MIHSDQGSPLTSRGWPLVLSHDRAIEGAVCSSLMARAVAESLFQLLKRARVRRRT
jgi:transposase InsO family protein